MNTLDAIRRRKSVRYFETMEIPHEFLENILLSGMQAPSINNSQPWKYYVLQKHAKDHLVCLMREALYHFSEKDGIQKLPFSTNLVKSIQIIQSAPVVILVFNTGPHTLKGANTQEGRFMDCVIQQTMGASIQNMLLTATEQGLGSLWMCDIYFAYKQICGWLKEASQLVAAIALGYASVGKPPKPARNAVCDHTIFMEEWR